jgi:hypothetical protein
MNLRQRHDQRELNNIPISPLRRAIHGCPVTVVPSNHLRAILEENPNNSTVSQLLLRASNWLRGEAVKVPDKQIQLFRAKMLAVNFLIAVYFSHLAFFSYKNLILCRESLMLLEYHKKIWNFVSISKNLTDIKMVIDFAVHGADLSARRITKTCTFPRVYSESGSEYMRVLFIWTDIWEGIR